MLKRISSICVFCGSSEGSLPVYGKTAAKIGNYFAENNIRLIFGGGRVGLMGVIARAVKTSGGEVVGVIPRNLQHEGLVFSEIDMLIVVDSMHDRKQKMYELADAFLVLPGGIGTMEEAFEIWTWSQLGLHQKPLGLLNVEHFFDKLLEFLDTMREKRFIDIKHRELLHVDTDIKNLMLKLNDGKKREGRMFVNDGNKTNKNRN